VRPPAKLRSPRGGKFGECRYRSGVRGVLDVRDRHGVGPEVECLLYRPALGPENLGDHLQPDGLGERDESLEVGEVECAVLDVQHQCTVAELTGDLGGGDIRSG